MYNSKISFSYCNSGGTSVTVTFDGSGALPEVLENFKGFLLAVGYVVKGDIIVDCEDK